MDTFMVIGMSHQTGVVFFGFDGKFSALIESFSLPGATWGSLSCPCTYGARRSWGAIWT